MGRAGTAVPRHGWGPLRIWGALCLVLLAGCSKGPRAGRESEQAGQSAQCGVDGWSEDTCPAGGGRMEIDYLRQGAGAACHWNIVVNEQGQVCRHWMSPCFPAPPAQPSAGQRVHLHADSGDPIGSGGDIKPGSVTECAVPSEETLRSYVQAEIRNAQQLMGNTRSRDQK